ncbi:unnamed protein product [Rhizoctonia solani]|uniref:NodB homology domain-containing protein n=1 Tax=Rhizoctonia solani TaxID=456999 RepID=A0A8H2XYX5_9AGAM|nr:unnamed protein product [Rhizoctonia solani]
MQFFAKLALVGSLASSLLGVLAAPVDGAVFPRQLAQVITSCTVPNTVALTFDDGPYLYTYEISEMILAAGGKATFFLNGNNYECIYSKDNVDRIKYLHDKGHHIGSHTWGHKNLTTLSWDEVHHEMWLVEEAMQRIIGVTPAFMRPPFGSYNDNVLRASAVRGQKVAIWDFDSGDSAGLTAEDSKKRYDEIATKRPSNILALNHETYEQTAHDILPYAIEKLQAKGYKMVTLSECLGEPAYQFIGSPASGSWSC